jgi:hypothetical protein
VPGVSIEECKHDMIKKMNEEIGRYTAISRKERSVRPRTVFFDFSSAYDTVNREKLYEMLRIKGILNQHDIELLEFIHYNLRIDIGGKSITTSRGVPQGLTTSPILFDIYVEGILENLQKANHFSRMFADDLACVAEDEDQAKSII